MKSQYSMSRARIRAAMAVAFFFVGGFAAGTANAQGLSGTTPDQIQQMMQSLPAGLQQKLQQLQQPQNGQSQGGQTQQSQQPIVLTPSAAQNNLLLPQSRLEQIMSARSGYKLQQFGYNQVGVGSSVTIPQTGAVQDSYVLGPGDEIDVTLRGQENSEFSTTVDRNGQVVLPRLAPIPATGRTLGDFRQALQAAVHRGYVSTEAAVTVGQLRQVTVMVAGEVANPGMRLLTASSTPLDAILLSGGIKKTGSLRSIRILRGGNEIPLDLYSVLTGHGRASDTLLADGDRILVPPLGPTVAIAGWVRRSGIYELAGRRSSTSVRDLLSLAGGLEVRGKYRLSVLRVLPDGRNEMMALAGQSGTVGDSDILFAQPAADQTTSMATLSGSTALAGQYATKNTKLSEILKSPGALGNEPYTLFGIISRRDSATLLRTLIGFTPVAVLNGTENMNIQSNDIVRVISVQEAQLLFATVQQYDMLTEASEVALRNPLSAGATLAPTSGNMAGQTQPATQNASDQAARATLAMAINAVAVNNAVLLNSSQVMPQSSVPYPQQANQPQQSGAGGGVQNPQQSGASGTQNPQQPSTGGYPQQPGMSGYPQQTGMGGYPQQPGMGSYLQQPGMGLGGAQSFGQFSAFNLEEGQASPGQVPSNLQITDINQLASQLLVDPLVLINFLSDRSMRVDGAVRGPGLYLVGPDASLQSVLAAAGGVAHWADKSAIEVISTRVDSNAGVSQTQRRTVSLADAAGADLIVGPHDEVRVSQVFTDVNVGSVTVLGEIRHSGTFQIVRGEHLSDVLVRAGGLTNSAYPYGTVFLRHSAAEREQDAFRREANEIEVQLIIAMSRRGANDKLSPDSFAAAQGYISQLKTQPALGRVTVVADPAVLAANPGADPLLEPGDIVYVPQRPFSISVLGEVLQPGSVPFGQDMSASDYIDRAGGYSQFADESETILVMPDGSARRVDSAWFNFGSDSIPPGSTIYVARDLSGLDMHQIIVDTTQIFSQLATAAAALALMARYSNTP